MLVQNHHLIRLLQDFDYPELEKIVPRHPRRVAIIHRVVDLGDRELFLSRSRLIPRTRFFPQSRVRYVRALVGWIVGIFVGAIWLDPFPDASCIPDPRNVTLGSRT